MPGWPGRYRRGPGDSGDDPTGPDGNEVEALAGPAEAEGPEPGPQLADLRTALKSGAPPAAVCYDLALVHAARGDRPAALADLRRALDADPGNREARALQDSLSREP